MLIPIAIDFSFFVIKTTTVPFSFAFDSMEKRCEQIISKVHRSLMVLIFLFFSNWIGC